MACVGALRTYGAPALLTFGVMRTHMAPGSGPVAKPPHGRVLGLFGVSLTKARLPKGCKAVLASVRDELEQMMLDTDYLQDASFSWVTVAVRFGLTDALDPVVAAINKRYGELPLSIEVDVGRLQGRTLAEQRIAYLRAVALALCIAGRKYGRSDASLAALTLLAEAPSKLAQ